MAASIPGHDLLVLAPDEDLDLSSDDRSIADFSGYGDEQLNAAAGQQIAERGEVPVWQAVFSPQRDNDDDDESNSGESDGPTAAVAESSCPYDGLAVRRFVVDLDLPARDRWTEVIVAYREQLVAADREISQQLRSAVGQRKGALLEAMASGILRTYAALGGVFFGAELAGISRLTGIPLGRLILIQLVYDFCAACTSVATAHDGRPVLFRNMDWEMPGVDLKPLTIHVEFVKGGRTLCHAATWAGCVGVFTGSKPQAFALSVNFRVTEDGTVWQNIRKGIARGWPVSFLCREVLESAPSYDVATAWLANSKTMSPTYLTVVGVQPGQGCVITRNRSGEEPDRRQPAPCAQTNIDHWRDDPDLDIMQSIRRRSIANRFLDHQQHAATHWHDYWRLLATPPVLNEITVYSVLMCPAADIFHIHVPLHH